MTAPRNSRKTGKFAAAFAVGAGLLFAVPGAVFALGGAGASFVPGTVAFAPFTPASVDPALARRVAESLRAKGLDLRFTPAGTTSARNQIVTVAIRVDDQTAQVISVRQAAAMAQAQPGTNTVAIAPMRYNLGVARGYQSFAKVPSASAPASAPALSAVEMPDLAQFKPAESTAGKKPSRFKPQIALKSDENEGRSPQTLESLGDQSFDLGGAYRVTRNLDVTAGVRLSQDRDRIDPLTDNVQDSQAVYVGTKLRF